MATVASQLTRIHDVEGSLTLTSIGGGAGGSANTELFIQGAQSAGRKQSNATDHGFWLTVTTRDVSGAGVHVGIWVNHIHYAVLTKLALRLGSTTANYHEHAFPLVAYPAKGGWVRVWINVSRTPEASSGTFDKTGLTQVAILASLPAVGGNAPNLIMDASDYVTAGLLLTGTSGLFADFIAADEANGTNKYGVVTSDSGVIFCLARLTLGSASSLAFNDSNFVVVFPNQSLAASNFMGITCDLQHASTAIALSNGVLKSAGTTRGDFVVTGTAGSLAVNVCSFAGMRVVTLTSACSALDCVFTSTGQVTAAGADLRGSLFSGYEGTTNSSLLVWDVATDVDGLLDDTAFTKGAAATHAFELGLNSPTTLTLRGIDFSGYNSLNNQDDSTLHVKRTTGTVTINLVGCSGNISYRTDGATVVLVVNPVTAAITVVDGLLAAIENARVLVTASNGTGPLPFQETVSVTRSGSTATVAHTGHGLETNQKILIKGADQQEYNGVHSVTVTTADEYTFTVSGTPATPATGPIVATGVVLEGLTNASGQISDTRSYTSNQPITGRARKSSTAPYYKTGPISGTVSSTSGFSTTVQLGLDQ